jgi:hypothetical protein
VLIDPSPYDAQNVTIKCVQCGAGLTTKKKGNALLQYFLRNTVDNNPDALLTPLERLIISAFAMGNWCAKWSSARLTRERS